MQHRLTALSLLLFATLPVLAETCRDLHKVADLKDLLQQIYANLDSHCLFDTPTAELEKTWGIPIINLESLGMISADYEERWEKRKSIDEKENTLFITKQDFRDGPQFVIEMSKSYQEQHGAFALESCPPPKSPLESCSPPELPQPETLESFPIDTDKLITHFYWVDGKRSPELPMLTSDSLSYPRFYLNKYGRDTFIKSITAKIYDKKHPDNPPRNAQQPDKTP